MRWKLTYAIVLLLTAVGLRLSGVWSAAVQGASDSDEIPQPPGWVAFEADLDATYPPGSDSPRVVGRFYRASDGSQRWETGPVDGTAKVISITNISKATMYTVYLGPGSDGVWRSYAMEFPPGAYRPLRYRLNDNLREYFERIEGYEVYEMASSEGDVTLLAPELNFFSLKTTSIANGRTRTYHNIKRIEPAPEVFLPPPNAKVEAQEQHLRMFSHEGDGPSAGEVLTSPF